MAAARFLISGKVQGVFFRAHTRSRALELGLRGFARNLNDGRVEVLALGDSAQLAALEKFLYQGSPQARVENVERFEVAEEDRQGFITA